MTLSRGRAWLVAVVATLAMTVSYVDRQVIAAIGMSVRTALHFDAQSFGWLASGFSLSYLVVAPLAGALVDRTGARLGLVAAILAWSLVSAAHAFAPSFAALFALRLLLGATEAPSFPGAAQSVRRALPPGDRSAAFGLIFTGSSFGAAVGAPLAVWLDAHYGWQAAFIVTSAIGLLWVPLWLVATNAPQARAALAVAHPYRQGDAPEAPARPPAVSVGTLLSDRAVLRALMLVLASAPALMFTVIWLPQYLELGRGVPRAELGRYLWLPPVMGDVGMFGFGLLASWRDRRSIGQQSHVPLVLLAATMAAGFALAPLMSGAWVAAALAGLAAVGCGGLYTLLTSDVMARVDPRRVSMVGGMCAASQSLVYVVLNPLVGRWVDRTHSFDAPIVMLSIVALPGAILWSLWRPRPAT
jgi:predicted MFS family arabinose efflux permease